MRLKAQDNNEASEAILVSFDSKWAIPLAAGSISQVFRKRGPKTPPKWVYVYAGSPTMAIIGRLPVIQLQQLEIEKALHLSKDGCIDKQELVDYAAGYKSLFVFSVGQFQPSHSNVDLRKLKDGYHFSPPQSFLILSHNGKKVLDELCQFRSEDKS
jgi:predicted transcriptional regulator